LDDKLERIWKEVAVSRFKTASLNLPGGTKENHIKSQSG